MQCKAVYLYNIAEATSKVSNVGLLYVNGALAGKQTSFCYSRCHKLRLRVTSEQPGDGCGYEATEMRCFGKHDDTLSSC